MNPSTLDWLLQADAWVEYRTRRDLLEQPETAPEVGAARRRVLAEPRIQALLTELAGWPGTVLNSHRSASQPFHKLAFIADLGLQVSDPPVGRIVKKVMQAQSAQGPFQLPMQVAEQTKGDGIEKWGWALCDAPVIVAALLQLGLGTDPRLPPAIEHLHGLVRQNGWPCAVSPELGGFRGPGRKEDPCPYATLVMLNVLAHVPAQRESPAAQSGVETLLGLWERSHERHPYMFFMGTDFRKLKAPLFWYDILHVLDVLSHFPQARPDPRFQEMLQLVESKADSQGRYCPESVWTAWRDWDFGQKKTASPGLTYYVERIRKRAQ